MISLNRKEISNLSENQLFNHLSLLSLPLFSVTDQNGFFKNIIYFQFEPLFF